MILKFNKVKLSKLVWINFVFVSLLECERADGSDERKGFIDDCQEQKPSKAFRRVAEPSGNILIIVYIVHLFNVFSFSVTLIVCEEVYA